jgi:site-specific DNA recombinase
MRLLVDAPGGTMRADPVLIRMLARAHALKAKLLQSGDDSLTQLADAEGVSRSYLTRLVRLAFLSPEIVGAILDGRQPANLTPARLSRLTRLPLDWSEQRKALGFN